MTNPVRFGLIGVGGVGGSHLKALHILQAEHRASLIAVADPTLPRLAAQKAQLESEGIRWHLDYESMLDQEPELEAVAIVTPIPLHREMTRRCLERGLFVYLEKPPVPLIQQLNALIDSDVHSRVGVGFQMVNSPQVQELKRLIVTGQLGDLQSINAAACWPRADRYYQRARWAGKMALDGEPIFDGPATNALAHLIHNIMFFASPIESAFEAPVEIQAELYRARPIESYDIASLKGRFESGLTFTANLTHATEEARPYRLEVRGSKGWARISQDGSKFESSVSSQNFENALQPAIALAYRDFIDYTRGERHSPATSLRDARGYLLATNGALLSSVTIHDVDPGHQRVYGNNGDSGYDVPGLTRMVDLAFERGCLLSEVGSPWTRCTQPVSVRDLTSIDLMAFCPPAQSN